MAASGHALSELELLPGRAGSGPGLNDDPDSDLLGACRRRMTELALPGLRLAL